MSSITRGINNTSNADHAIYQADFVASTEANATAAANTDAGDNSCPDQNNSKKSDNAQSTDFGDDDERDENKT